MFENLLKKIAKELAKKLSSIGFKGKVKIIGVYSNQAGLLEKTDLIPFFRTSLNKPNGIFYYL